MSQLASDNFNRANENPLGNGVWSTWFGHQAMQIVTNHVEPQATSGNDSGSVYTGISWPADHYSQANLTAGSTGLAAGIALMVRANTSDMKCYRLTVSHASPGANIQLERWDAAGFGAAIATFTQAWTDGDLWRLEVQGTSLRVYLNGSQVGTTQTDNNIATGSPGVGFSTTDTIGQADNWAGGDFATPAPIWLIKG